jgi:tRNA (cmo5U34)-methyltransferase
MQLPAEAFDIVVTGAAMHHLRTDEEWETVFTKIFKSLKKDGCFWISDLILHDNPAINQLMWKRYADYLKGIGGKTYQENVFEYIEKEDTPRSVMYQLDLMKKIGFSTVDVLHKNSCFSVFGGIK